MNDSKKIPCYGCSERFIGCHSYCEEYKAWTAKNKEILQQKVEQRKKDDVIYGYIKDRSSKAEKAKRRKR